MSIQKAVREYKATYHNAIEHLLDNSDKTNLVMGIVRDFKDLVRKPNGKRGWDILLWANGAPLFTIYCCVRNFSDVSPIAKRLEPAGYILHPNSTEDNKWNMSRTYSFKKGGKYSGDKINVVAYALEELGAKCRAVSIGYGERFSFAPEEQFKLVCDELEETALKADVEDPNYL